MSQPNSVDSLLIRLQLSDAIPAFREMQVDRIVHLRSLSPEDLAKAVPDPQKRATLIDAIKNRGSLRSRRGPSTEEQMQHPPRGGDGDVRGGFDEGYGFGGGPGRGSGGRGRGRGRGGMRGGMGRGGMGEQDIRVCRHFFGPEGCTYGDSCRYSHDVSQRDRVMAMQPEGAGVGQPRPYENLALIYDYSEDIEFPTERIKFLLGGGKLKLIHEQCETQHERFDHVDEDTDTFVLKLYAKSRESLQRAKEKIICAVGVKKEEMQKQRFQYAVNELEANVHAVKLLAACNTKNTDTPDHLSDHILKSIISTFRFVKPQEVRHFYMNTTSSDKDKLEVVSRIVTQLKGVQAILFCEQKRVEEMSKGAQRIARYFNNVEPKFVYRQLSKEDRMQALEDFKKGVENENGVKQRLLVTSEDYAKLARKTVIPYVNLVINFSVPRTEEFYILQSLVAGRQGTVGASFLCVCQYEEDAFRDLEKTIHFEKYTDDESFRSTAMELSYDTRTNPLTPEDADPPADWREHLNDKKPKQAFTKRR